MVAFYPVAIACCPDGNGAASTPINCIIFLAAFDIIISGFPFEEIIPPAAVNAVIAIAAADGVAAFVSVEGAFYRMGCYPRAKAIAFWKGSH